MERKHRAKELSNLELQDSMDKWQIAKDSKTGRHYYFNKLTKQRTWTDPDRSALMDAIVKRRREQMV